MNNKERGELLAKHLREFLVEKDMTKADKKLLELGWKPTTSPFEDWYMYENKGRVITFQNDYNTLYCNFEIMFSIEELLAFTEKGKELGWLE